jgi:hypothetical protein
MIWLTTVQWVPTVWSEVLQRATTVSPRWSYCLGLNPDKKRHGAKPWMVGELYWNLGKRFEGLAGGGS